MTNDTAAIAVLCLLVLLSIFVFIFNTFTLFVLKETNANKLSRYQPGCGGPLYWAHRNNRGRWWVDFSRSNRLKQNNPRSQ